MKEDGGEEGTEERVGNDNIAKLPQEEEKASEGRLRKRRGE